MTPEPWPFTSVVLSHRWNHIQGEGFHPPPSLINQTSDGGTIIYIEPSVVAGQEYQETFAPLENNQDNRLMSHHVSETDLDTVAIAAQLQETESGVITQIARILERMGSEFVQTVLADTLRLEAEGGMLTEDKQRRRTPGGVFFYLVRGRVSPEDRKALFPIPRRPAKPALPATITLSDAERLALYNQIKAHLGVATNMKLTLIGRPAKILKRDTFVVVTLASREPPALPKGLPELPSEEPTVYLVYIASKQWRKVEESIQNPEDKLIIEGYPYNDKKMGVIGVLTQSVTTVNLQRAKKEADKKSEPA